MQNLGASQCRTNVLVRCLGYIAVWWFRLLFLLLVFLFRLNLFFSEAPCGSQQPSTQTHSHTDTQTPTQKRTDRHADAKTHRHANTDTDAQTHPHAKTTDTPTHRRVQRADGQAARPVQ